MKSTVGPCQLCNREDLEKFEIPNSSVLWLCRDCELYQYGEIVDEDAYAAEYHSGYERHREQKIRTANIRLNRAASLVDVSATASVRSAPKILDIGCSVGATLEAAKQIGWDAIGVDVSQDAVDFCNKAGLVAKKVDGLKLPFADDSFDIVCNWHVVEHVEDVRQTLAEWNRVIKPGGLLVMETPDAASPKVRKLGPAYRKFWAPEHTYTFTYKNLSRFVEDSGFEVESSPMIGSLRNFSPTFAAYAAAYQTYHGLRKLMGVQKAFQIFARKPVLQKSSPQLAAA